MSKKIAVMFGDNMSTPGGERKNFDFSLRLRLKRKMVKEKDGRVSGQTITAETYKNKLSIPFQNVDWDFMFSDDGRGYFDTVGSTLDYCISSGILKTSGAYVEWIDGKKYYKSVLAEKLQTEGIESQLYSLLKN